MWMCVSVILPKWFLTLYPLKIKNYVSCKLRDARFWKSMDDTRDCTNSSKGKEAVRESMTNPNHGKKNDHSSCLQGCWKKGAIWFYCSYHWLYVPFYNFIISGKEKANNLLQKHISLLRYKNREIQIKTLRK